MPPKKKTQISPKSSSPSETPGETKYSVISPGGEIKIALPLPALLKVEDSLGTFPKGREALLTNQKAKEWSSLEYWQVWQACLLIHGIEPESSELEKFSRYIAKKSSGQSKIALDLESLLRTYVTKPEKIIQTLKKFRQVLTPEKAHKPTFIGEDAFPVETFLKVAQEYGLGIGNLRELFISVAETKLKELYAPREATAKDEPAKETKSLVPKNRGRKPKYTKEAESRLMKLWNHFKDHGGRAVTTFVCENYKEIPHEFKNYDNKPFPDDWTLDDREKATTDNIGKALEAAQKRKSRQK